jgi:hypothetical protein
MKIQRRKRAPKTYKEPKHLSLDATGLLAHMRANVSSDRTYRWGVEATAEFFGLSGRNRIRDAYDELEEKGEVRNVPQKPLPTGKQSPRTVKLKPWSPITTDSTSINTGDFLRSATERRTVERRLKATDESLRVHRVRVKEDPSLLPVIKSEEADIKELRARLEGAR